MTYISFQNFFLCETEVCFIYLSWMVIIFFQSWVVTIIYSDETVVRILERYITMKYFMIFYHW